MGGYVCAATIATADQWKLGQLRPGDTVQFRRISIEDAAQLRDHTDKWLETVLALTARFNAPPVDLLGFMLSRQFVTDPKLHVLPSTAPRSKVVFRQVHFDNGLTSQAAILEDLILAEQSLPDTNEDMSFAGMKLTLPIVLDDK
ncbi:hypothetical protein EUX98_g5774 [Antrodiella citrinella]|uniref:Carboxyltransferase domain-containing protein n=1 Tax=Antrodiella citrinella TaxID=2447956 RepID=A0A4S4MRL8_9APHY|nr:hypothetical protein EUX98_g5774 [Antrodiella citrinella]